MHLFKRIRCRFPSRLPNGVEEFKAFVDDIAELSGLPNNEKLQSVISSFILSLHPTTDAIPKLLMAQQLRKAAANQVAFEMLDRLKEKQNEGSPVGEASSPVGQEAC